MRFTMVAMALPDFSRSALPNFTPLIPQFAPNRDLGVSRLTKTPTKPSQAGSALLTASAIADCKLSADDEIRSSNSCASGSQTMTPHSEKRRIAMGVPGWIFGETKHRPRIPKIQMTELSALISCPSGIQFNPKAVELKHLMN
jgi:hypothetical protein